MRKVTASAVILTALTGCSQSGGIPSTQWSFKVPAADEVSKAQLNTGKSSPAGTLSKKADALTSEKSGQIKFDSKKASVADASPVVSRSASARFMGPAFEQPDAASGDSVSTVAKLGGKDATDLSAETYGLANGLGSTQASTRPDPVAQVRAYLRSGNPSALTNRNPYSSQVYLSSLPVPNQYYDPAKPVVDLDNGRFNDGGATVNALDIGPTGLGSNALDTTDSLTNTVFSDSEDIPNYSSLGLLETAPTATVSEAPSLPGLPGSFVSSGLMSSADYSAADSSSGYNDDGLPQLTASTSVADSYTEDSDVTESYTAESYDVSIAPLPEQQLPEAQPLNASQSVEEVSIGTAILNEIRRSSESEIAADQTIRETPIQISQSYESQPYESQPSDYSQSVAIEPAYAPSSSPDVTLTSLAQTMPARELSPLVASYRAGRGLSELSPAENLSESAGSEPGLPAIAPDAGSNTPYSLLLKGLRDSSFAEASEDATIYVPIAAAIPAEPAAVSTQAALDALDPTISSTAFISGLVQRDIFSSVLSTQALTSPQPSVRPGIAQRIPLSSEMFVAQPAEDAFEEALLVSDVVSGERKTAAHMSGILSFDISDKADPDTQAWQNDKARRAKLTPAYTQSAAKRQRLTLL